MKLKTCLITALATLAVVAVACSAQTNNVELVGTTAVDSSCKIVANTFLQRGFLDLSTSNQFLLPLRFTNTATATDTTINGQSIGSTNLDFFGQQLVVSYTSTPSASWATETEQQSFTMPAGADPNNSFLLADLIQPKALAQLQSMTANGPVTLNATVKIKGNYANGSSGETNSFTFPLTVVASSSTTCPAGQVAVTPTVCGNPQGEPFCGDAGTP